MNSNSFPKFLSNRPDGTDKFSGGSQTKISEKIAEIIRENELETKIIGLDGDWGSGKSNVIKLIQNKLKKEGYHTFIFDAWGSQEDLTRKSFLEQIIEELFEENLLTNKEKWKKRERELLSKTSRSFKQKFPKIKHYWFMITLSIILLSVLSGFYENVLINKDISSFNFGIWKPIISIYFIPVVFLIWGIILIILEYYKERTENKKKRAIDQVTRWDTIGKILYWFKGQDIESEEVENIIENDPSVSMFRKYFSEIEKDIAQNRKLIIVFDNLDRLDIQKVKSLWSSIHTFFAESKDNFESWVIIPYNKNELLRLFSDDNQGGGFIEKSFPINFRVTPPVVTEWEDFLIQKLESSFNNLISTKQKVFIKNIFDALVKDSTIKPRRIIIFINDIVALYKQWEDEIKNDKIKIHYLALFSLTKDKIIINPNEVIPSRSYLASAENLFINKSELDETISALTFGIDPKLANEVLLFREFKSILREGNDTKLKKYLNHSAFENYFNKAYNDLPLNDKIKGLSNILNSISESLSFEQKKYYWNDFAEKIIDSPSNFDFFNDNHKEILKNVSPKLGEKILSRLINLLKENISKSEEDIEQNKYYKQLIEIEKFLNENKNIDLNLKGILPSVNFDPVPYIDLVSDLKEDYSNYKIECSEEPFLNYFFNENNTLKIEVVKSCLDQLIILKDKFNLSKITKALAELIKTVTYNQPDELKKYISILKYIESKPLSLNLSPNFYAQLSSNLLDSNEIYYDAYCIGLSDFTEAIKQGNFINTTRNLTEKQLNLISERVEWYETYQKFLELTTNSSISSSYPRLKDIISNLTNNNYGSSILNINWVIKNFTAISNNVLDNDNIKKLGFLKNLESWSSNFKTPVDEIDINLYEHLNQKDNGLIKIISNSSLSYIEDLTKEEILTSFKERDRNYTILTSLLENNLITKFSNHFYSAFDSYFKSLAKDEIEIPGYTFWDNLIDKMDARKLRTTFTSIRDIIINERGELNEKDIIFFEKGLISYGNLDKKPNESLLKLIIPMIKSGEGFDVLLNKKNSLIKIINSSTEHRESALSELQIRYSSQEYKDNNNLIEIVKELKIESKMEE